ncbi:MAG: polyphosphate kinase 1 [Planctomycetota bacterium]|nr:MAG: polyphosphate kinase 1 [Planctomycetota bacterium]
MLDTSQDAALTLGDPGTSTTPSSLSDPAPINRELSWLDFNARVLHLASEADNPLLERVKFLAISETNLDEFVMKRVGGLMRQIRSGVARRSPDGRTPGETLDAIRLRIAAMQRDQAAIYTADLLPALRNVGVELLTPEQLHEEERRRLAAWARASVYPVLTPLAVDPGHPFPFISNLSVSLGVMLEHPERKERLFARVKSPSMLPRWVDVDRPGEPIEGRQRLRLIRLRDVLVHNLADLFPGMRIVAVMPFRLTRNADIEHEAEGADDLLAAVEEEMRERRFAEPVRLETGEHPNPELLSFVVREIGLDERDVYRRPGCLHFADLFEIAAIDRPDLHYPPHRPVVPARLADDEADIFSIVRQGDLLVRHPYESFAASVERFIRTASHDPATLVIKQTLYRTSRDSPFVPELIRAAEAGKQAACLVELRARFDEVANMEIAQQLEDAGVHVAYGVLGLKTHAKMALVVRQERDAPNRLRAYAHIGTGNYNSLTAQQYTDVGLLTCDPDITADVVDLFNYLTGRSLKRDYRCLLVAPANMRRRFLELIDAEIHHARSGAPARIVAKMNALQDEEIIHKLYDASRAGVQVDLLVRGFCCLRPGVADASERIRVVSVVGRFLSHSRIYHFAQGREDPLEGEWLIGSADWMHRNLDARVEAVVPVRDQTLRARLHEIVQAKLRDCRGGWELLPSGRWRKRLPPPDAPPDSPERLGAYEWLLRRAEEDAASR